MKVRIRLSIGKKAFLLLGFFVVLAGLAIVLSNLRSPKATEGSTIVYEGIPFSFEKFLKGVSLEEVKKEIKLSQEEEKWLKETFLTNPSLKNVYIIFENTSQNSLVALGGIEIASKLTLLYTHQGRPPVPVANYTQFHEAQRKGMLTIFPLHVTSVEGFENASSESPAIALVPPVISNETGIKIKGYTVIIQGKSEEGFRKAVVRFLLALVF